MNYIDKKKLLITILNESIFKNENKIKEVVRKIGYKKSEEAMERYLKKVKKDSLKELDLINAFLYSVINKYI